MAQEQQKTNLPEVTYMEGEEEKTLPPVQGRGTYKERSVVAGKQANGYRITVRYTMTLAELTIAFKRLQENMYYTQKSFKGAEERLRHYIELPETVGKFMQSVRSDLDAHIEEVNKVITEVYTSLNELLDGKAKPNGDVMNLILDAINQQSQRIDILEQRMQPRAQQAKTIRGEES